ncbi:hypothetical protein [Streptomyces sp. H27-H1]|uniref:hypothetical protein n=1 Tax=Streptomyces sp. H27-H1 TaxID=2996461 RepID=UPI003B63B10E
MGKPRRLVARTAERYAAVQKLLTEGKSLAAIGRILRLDHSAVRRFARAGSLDELLAKATGRLSVLDEHKPYLLPAGWKAVTTSPSSTGNCESADLPEVFSASAATSGLSDRPASQGGSSSAYPGLNRGRRRSPDASSGGSSQTRSTSPPRTPPN